MTAIESVHKVFINMTKMFSVIVYCGYFSILTSPDLYIFSRFLYTCFMLPGDKQFELISIISVLLYIQGKKIEVGSFDDSSLMI